jgi:hypothetical protein
MLVLCKSLDLRLQGIGNVDVVIGWEGVAVPERRGRNLATKDGRWFTATWPSEDLGCFAGEPMIAVQIV